MPLTEVEAEYLQGIVDDLRVAHEKVLDTLTEMRVERDLLVKIAGVAGLYIEARNGLNEIDPVDLLAHLDRSILDYHQHTGGQPCTPTP